MPVLPFLQTVTYSGLDGTVCYQEMVAGAPTKPDRFFGGLRKRLGANIEKKRDHVPLPRRKYFFKI